MAFEHGIKYSEVATTLVPLREVDAPTVVVGTAAIHLASDPAPVNEPVLCNSFSEYVKRFGYAGDFGKYTCEEACYTHFILYNIKPLIVINVLDSATHIKTGSHIQPVSASRNTYKINVAAVLSTLTVKSGETALTKDTDYTAAYNSSGQLELTIKNRTKITNNSVTLSYSEIDTTKVTTAEIIGGTDSTTLKKKGIEAIGDVYPKLGVLPGVLIAPKYSIDSEVAAVMKSKVTNVNDCFNCIAIADINTATATRYTDCYEYKTGNNLVDENLIVTWPKVTLGGVRYYLSSHTAALCHSVDLDYDGVPCASPSNHSLQIDGLCLANGEAVYLDKASATYLNSVGIVTALNLGGFRLWGNRTSIYPETTDPKDVFIPLRRTIQFLGNNIILSFFSRVDQPLNRVFIESVETSVQQYLNGLAASGYILGGTIQFSEEDNQIVDLIDGKIRFDLSVGFLVPAESINFSIEFDPTLYETLFS